MLAQLLIVGALVFIIFRIWIYPRIQFKSLDGISGPMPGLLGNAIEMGTGESLIGKLMEFKEKYGPIYKLWFGPTMPAIMFTGVDGIEAILKSNSQLSKGFVYEFLHRWLGLGLLTSTGSSWKSQRRLLTPAFHFKILENYLKLAENMTDPLIERLKQTNGQFVDCFPFVTNYTLDVIGVTAFGTNLNAQKDVENAYVKAVSDAAEGSFGRSLNPLYFFDPIWNAIPFGKKTNNAIDYLHSYTRKVIADRRVILSKGSEASANRKKDFLDILLTTVDENGKGFSDQEILDQVETFMFEGHDTTAHGIMWTLYHFARNPEVQKKAQEEIDEIYSSIDRLEMEDLKKFEYLGMCINESHRLSPPVPFIGRQLDEDLQVSGHTIPKGTTVMVIMFAVHHDASVWPDPEKFIPERFSKDAERRNPFAFVPFSAGPRNCIGQSFALNEEKVALSTILKHFEVSYDPSHPIVRDPRLILAAKTGVWLKFTPRRK